MDIQWHDVLGTLGAATIIVVYFMLQLDRLDSKRLAFSLLNGIGAGFILVSLVYEFNLAAFVIEFFWVVISLYGVIRVTRRQRVP